MKKTLIIILALIVMFSFVEAKKVKVKVNPELKKRINAYYSSRAAAVVMKEGLPGMTERGEKMESTDDHYPMTCTDGGPTKLYFKIRIFTPHITSEFEKGQILSVVKVSVKKKGIWFMLRSLEGMALKRGEGIFQRKELEFHRIGFMFKFSAKYYNTNSDENFEFIKQTIEKFFSFQPTIQDAEVFVDSQMDTTVEITEGMTIAEVVKALGVPKKKAKIGNKVMYKYEDMKVVFEDGKVVKVDF